jgi:hypothetical protein
MRITNDYPFTCPLLRLVAAGVNNAAPFLVRVRASIHCMLVGNASRVFNEAILDGKLLDLSVTEARKLLCGLDVTNLLSEALSKYYVNLFEASQASLGVEPVDDRQEASINGREKEISSPSDGANHDRCDHDLVQRQKQPP